MDKAVRSTRPSYAAPALSKGLDVLELLGERGIPLTMKEVADGLGQSKSEIFRMLITLQERDYIARDPGTDAYSLTDRLFKLGLQTPKVRDLLAAAMPEMVRLADRPSNPRISSSSTTAQRSSLPPFPAGPTCRSR